MAVVGNVGTYAQVQPVEGPNFGAMVQNQFDKLDAERKAKKVAEDKAKAKKQEQLDKLSLPEMEMLNINGLQDQRYNYWKSKVSEFARLKEAGDYNGAQRLINSLESEANAVKQTNAKIKSYYDNEGKYDENYFKKVVDLTTAVDKGNVDIVDKGDGELRYNIYKDAEKKELLYEAITPFEYISKIEVPFKFDSTKEAKSFASTFRLDEIDKEIDTKTKYGTVQSKDLMDNERVLGRIDVKAGEYTEDDRAMAHFGKTINKYETRASNYTEEEKKEAKDYFTTLLKDAYQEEVELRISQKAQKGGGGSKDGVRPGTPARYEAGGIQLNESEVVNGQSKTEIELDPTQSFSTSITNSKGDPLKVGSMPLDRIVFDKKTGRLYVSLSEGVSTGEGAGGDNKSYREGDSGIKKPGWYGQNSDVFNRLISVLNSSAGLNLKTTEDVKNYLFGDDRL